MEAVLGPATKVSGSRMLSLFITISKVSEFSKLGVGEFFQGRAR